MQLAGLCLKAIGYGICIDKGGVRDTARLVISQVLIVRPFDCSLRLFRS